MIKRDNSVWDETNILLVHSFVNSKGYFSHIFLAKGTEIENCVKTSMANSKYSFTWKKELKDDEH